MQSVFCKPYIFTKQPKIARQCTPHQAETSGGEVNECILQSNPLSITYFMPEYETCEFQFHMDIKKSEFSGWDGGIFSTPQPSMSHPKMKSWI